MKTELVLLYTILLILIKQRVVFLHTALSILLNYLTLQHSKSEQMFVFILTVNLLQNLSGSRLGRLQAGSIDLLSGKVNTIKLGQNRRINTDQKDHVTALGQVFSFSTESDSPNHFKMTFVRFCKYLYCTLLPAVTD